MSSLLTYLTFALAIGMFQPSRSPDVTVKIFAFAPKVLEVTTGDDRHVDQCRRHRTYGHLGHSG
jgi:hypothetical protein